MTRGALMIQGNGSDVGKSTIVAGLCRVARRRLAPTVDMNPVLLKPQFDRTSSARIVRSEFSGG